MGVGFEVSKDSQCVFLHLEIVDQEVSTQPLLQHQVCLPCSLPWEPETRSFQNWNPQVKSFLSCLGHGFCHSNRRARKHHCTHSSMKLTFQERKQKWLYLLDRCCCEHFTILSKAEDVKGIANKKILTLDSSAVSLQRWLHVTGKQWTLHSITPNHSIQQ